MRCLLGTACALTSLALAAGAARAGGTQVEVVAVAGRVWVTTGYDVAKLDAFTGRVLRRVTTRYPYPIDVGVSDGSVWVTSVENGFGAGALTRIPFEAGRVTQPLVFPKRPMLALAVGSGATWALVGPWRSLELARVDQVSGRTSLRPIRHDIGWLAADNTGLIPGLFGVTTHGGVVRIRPDGSIRKFTSLSDTVGPPTLALGSVWIANRTTLYRVNARTGQTKGSLTLRGTIYQVVVGGGYAWLLSSTSSTSHPLLTKIEPASMRVVASAEIAGSFGAMAFGNDALWIGRSAPRVAVLRIDPRTLTRKTFATLGP